MRHRLVNLWQSVIGVINRATTLIAIACAAFAVMQELSQRTILPTWMWWSAALVLLFLSGIGLQRHLMREQEKRPAVQPDRTLSDIIAEILGTQDPESFGASTRLSQLFGRIREAASLGLISVWGRKNVKPHHLDFHPLERIPESHWSGAKIDFLEYVRDPRSATSDTRHPGSPDHYSDQLGSNPRADKCREHRGTKPRSWGRANAFPWELASPEARLPCLKRFRGLCHLS